MRVALLYGVSAVVAKAVSHSACAVDNCLRAIEATIRASSVQASRKADCRLMLASTVTPSASIVYTTVTSVSIVESTAATDDSASAVENRRDAAIQARTTPAAHKTQALPSYASLCKSSVRYASACSCAGVTGSTKTLSTPTITSTIVISTVSTSIYTEPSYAPEYPVTIPVFDDWTSTYTYEEATLPVFPPFTPLSLPTPSPTTECFINPTQSGAAFYLLDQATGDFLFDNNGILGPLSVPTDPAIAAAWQADLANVPDPPQFTFEQPPKASMGLSDIVLVGSLPKQYIAMKASGEMVLSSTSTNGATVKSLSTTVFGVTCRGQMQVVKGTKTYIWQVSGPSSKAKPGDPTSTTSMVILPQSGYKSPSEVQKEIQNAAASGTPARRRRRNMDEHGMAPRCPNYPEDVTAYLKSGGSGGDDDRGCGPWNGIAGQITSKFFFDDCCDWQDGCFGTCLLPFEACQAIYTVCLYLKCIEWFDDLWTYPVGWACLGLSHYYTYSAWTDLGKTAFYEANKESCTCLCDDHSKTTCPVGNGYQCINIHSNDNNNCGGCGQSCGTGAKCVGGECKCNHDQCGSLCVDLRNHPRNCGSCGKVCKSGYCWQGVCYDPPPNPTSCLPMDGVMNGGFAHDGSYWTASADDGVLIESWSNYDASYSAGDAANGDTHAMQMYFTPNQNPRNIWINQDVHLCPGQRYRLEFQMRRSTGDGNCSFMVTMPQSSTSRIIVKDLTSLPNTGSSWPNTWAYDLPAVFYSDSFGVSPASRFYITVNLQINIVCWPIFGGWHYRSESSRVFLDSVAVFPVD